MKTIRIGNDVGVLWRVYSSDGMAFPLVDKITRLWLVSGPFKKEITGYDVGSYYLSFTIDKRDLLRLGVYKLVLTLLDSGAMSSDAAIDVTEAFQIVSKDYAKPDHEVLDGTVVITPSTVLNNIVSSGLPGKSAYDIAVDHGYRGTEDKWLDSLEGKRGPIGPIGITGLQGVQGLRGPAGLTGGKGDKGDKGDSGVSLGEVALTTNLDETETGKALDASAMQTIPSMTDAEEEIEEVPSNFYNRATVDALIDSERIARQKADLAQDSEFAGFKSAVRDEFDNIDPIVIRGDVTNAPDEEDITSMDGLLKLKDRSSLYGMGYCILRRGASFAEQVTHVNTIYEIRYDFDLGGEEVEIPSGCTLKFEGGSINNGTLKLNGCDVLPRYNPVINPDLTTNGMPKAGVFFFQNGIPTWSDGTNWVNASGEIVE